MKQIICDKCKKILADDVVYESQAYKWMDYDLCPACWQLFRAYQQQLETEVRIALKNFITGEEDGNSSLGG